MKPKADAIDYDAHREYFREVLQAIHIIMKEHYGLHDIVIRPLGSSGSRLSIPIKIEGINSEATKVKLFAKILGNSELMTAKTIQLFKNIFLQMNAKKPMFNFNASAEYMAHHQYDLLKAIHDLEIPTARPLGYHELKEGLWILVEEFLEAKPINDVSEITMDHLDTAFSYLAKMHKKDIYHGDIKPENILFAEKIYIMDVGNFLDEAPKEEKRAYDIACQIATFLEYAPPEKIIELALNHYSKKDIRHATEYIDLIQHRPDINFSDSTKQELLWFMNHPGKKRIE